MEITIEQLKSLLNMQKGMCMNHFEECFKKSEFLKELKKIDPTEKVINMRHEVRDQILGADYPDEYNILAKYLTTKH
jgi:hypothetical protein